MPETVIHTRLNRARVILATAIFILLALLAGLVYLFYTLIRPAGIPRSDTTVDKLVWVRSMYGFGPAKDQQLRAPSSVAIAPNGDIYATDPMRARIMVFRSDGTFKRLLHTAGGGTRKGMFIRPESIDIDESGDVYIADSWANKIIVFDSEGAFAREWPTDTQARGVACADGKVYVLGAGRVYVFDSRGRAISAFGARGPMPGQVDAYQGITARNGTVYVAESLNKRLQAFSESGTIEWTAPDGPAGRRGPTNQSAPDTRPAPVSSIDVQWDLPQDIVFDGRGRIVVIDAFRFEFVVVDPETGAPLEKYGEFGRQDGQMFYPTSVDYDPVRDWFVVADTNNDRVQIFRLPKSSDQSGAVVWRALASPYRYLAIPVGLTLCALLLGAWMVRRSARTIPVATSSDD